LEFVCKKLSLRKKENTILIKLSLVLLKIVEVTLLFSWESMDFIHPPFCHLKPPKEISIDLI